MITKEQIAHFETFGFLVLRQAFSPDETERIAGRYEHIQIGQTPRIEKAADGRPAARAYNYVVETDPVLAKLAEDDRIYETIEQLLGRGFIWTGSEWICGRNQARWHADRQDGTEVDYMTIKVHLYLDPTQKETCALRVIPGSHRSPFHEALKPHCYEENARPYGMDAQSVPCYAFESNPGDVIFFNQFLLHAVFGSLENERRYVALKFGARIRNEDDIAALMRYKPDGRIFKPHEAFVTSESARIRGMVEGLSEAHSEDKRHR